MATVIDSLMIELGLDTSKFSDAQKKVVESLRKTDEQANKSNQSIQRGVKQTGGEFDKVKDSIIEESKQKATEEANRIVISAKESIQNEKMAAITELKNQLAELSLEVAKKILQRELSDPEKQEAYSKELMKDVKFN